MLAEIGDPLFEPDIAAVLDEAMGVPKGIYEVPTIRNGSAVRQWGAVTKKNRKLIEDLGLEDLIVSH